MLLMGLQRRQQDARHGLNTQTDYTKRCLQWYSADCTVNEYIKTGDIATAAWANA